MSKPYELCERCSKDYAIWGKLCYTCINDSDLCINDKPLSENAQTQHIVISSSDTKFLSSLVDWLTNYPGVEKNSTTIKFCEKEPKD